MEDALVAVRQQTAMMRKCLDSPGKLMDALKCWYVIPAPGGARHTCKSARSSSLCLAAASPPTCWHTSCYTLAQAEHR
jgi:hypothetical protein